MDQDNHKTDLEKDLQRASGRNVPRAPIEPLDAATPAEILGVAFALLVLMILLGYGIMIVFQP